MKNRVKGVVSLVMRMNGSGWEEETTEEITFLSKLREKSYLVREVRMKNGMNE